MNLVIQDKPVPLGADPDGVVRVAGTRVTLDVVVNAYNSGATPEQIAEDFSSLELSDIYDVISFYLRNRFAVDSYLSLQRNEAAEIRKQMEEQFDPTGIRERLMARKSLKESGNAPSAG